MRQKRLQEFTGSSAGWGGPGGSGRQVSDFLKRGQRAYPEIKRRDKRLLEEALDFLLSAEGTSDPEGTLKALFAIYEEIDPYADYIKPGEREFFPILRRERTLERFLEGFKYIYYILLRAQERLYLANTFGVFWERCTEYLQKCGYRNKYIYSICGQDSLFYRQSFSYWRSEFKDEEEGFLVMYAYFKVCFGIEGNDEYCSVAQSREVTYDWRRMKACFEKLRDSAVRETVVPEPEYKEWSEKNKRMVRQRIEAYKNKRSEEIRKSELVLENIKRRNEREDHTPFAAVAAGHG
jgi:hypothetical protein